MGSYNITCGVSHLSIGYGDPVVVIPLIPSPQDEINLKFLSTAHILGGITAWYKPFCLPIKGFYNDYGRVVVPRKKTPNVKAIEKHFKTSIGLFLNALTDCRRSITDDMSELSKIRNKKARELLAKSACMFIHGDIYDALVNSRACEWPYMKYNWNETTDLDTYTLARLGFQFVAIDETDKRYNQVYRWPSLSLDKLKVLSDRKWIRVLVNGEQEKHCYHPEQLINVLRSAGVTDVPDFDVLDQQHPYDWIFEKFKISMQEYKDRDKPKLNAARDMWLWQPKADLFAFSFDRDPFQSLHDLYHFYGESILDGSIKLEMLEWAMLKQMLFAANIMLRPTMQGPQCGADRVNWVLAGATRKVTLRRIAEAYVNNEIDDLDGEWEWDDLEELQPYIEIAREEERKLQLKIEKMQKKKVKKKKTKKKDKNESVG